MQLNLDYDAILKLINSRKDEATTIHSVINNMSSAYSTSFECNKIKYKIKIYANTAMCQFVLDRCGHKIYQSHHWYDVSNPLSADLVSQLIGELCSIAEADSVFINTVPAIRDESVIKSVKISYFKYGQSAIHIRKGGAVNVKIGTDKMKEFFNEFQFLAPVLNSTSINEMAVNIYRVMKSKNKILANALSCTVSLTAVSHRSLGKVLLFSLHNALDCPLIRIINIDTGELIEDYTELPNILVKLKISSN